MQRTADIVAVMLAICGFSAAVLAGMASANAPLGVVGRAMIVMFVCWMVGMVIGRAIEAVVREHLALYAAAHPVPAHIDARTEAGAEDTDPPRGRGDVPEQSTPAARERAQNVKSA